MLRVVVDVYIGRDEAFVLSDGYVSESWKPMLQHTEAAIEYECTSC